MANGALCGLIPACRLEAFNTLQVIIFNIHCIVDYDIVAHFNIICINIPNYSPLTLFHTFFLFIFYIFYMNILRSVKG